jgi:hypothetical protein
MLFGISHLISCESNEATQQPVLEEQEKATVLWRLHRLYLLLRPTVVVLREALSLPYIGGPNIARRLCFARNVVPIECLPNIIYLNSYL